MLEFQNVSFSYEQGNPVLRDVSFRIGKGECVGLIGANGAGKSTVMKLLLGLLEGEGSILVDGRDVRERSQLWLRSHIACVLQTPHLFSGTIRDNLLYGRPDATEEDIREALELVSAADLIDGLPQGLDTDVGESGDLLSTGEKQLPVYMTGLI